MLLLLIAYLLLGLVIGSFLNVCIYRIPRRESIVFPGSHCPHCGKSIRPYDNVPVLAFLWLRGKCRFCRKPISLQYPVVELLGGLSFLSCALRWDFAPATYVNSAFLAAVLVLVFIDYHHQILPNRITIPGTALGIVLSPMQVPGFFEDPLSLAATSFFPADPAVSLPWIGSLVGAGIGGGSLLAVGSAYRLIRRMQGMGMGDVKMMAMVGAFLGWRLAFLTIFAGSVVGSLVGVFLVVFRGRTLQTKLAFGTFLGAGAVLALFFGIPFLEWLASPPAE
jgi:leader peptidase (prepilin peptidase)/N-methyltransferase